MKKLRTIIYSTITALVVASVVYAAQFFPDIIVTSPNGVWTDTRAYTNMAAAVAAIGANDRDMYIVSQENFAGTIPSNISLHFRRDGGINATGAVTINTTSIHAPNQQIYFGSGSFDFADGSVVRSAHFANIEEAIDETTNDTVVLSISEVDNLNVSDVLGNNVTLRWEGPGLRLGMSSGVVFSNISSIEAGDYLISSGNGRFDFNNGSVVKSTWFNQLRTAGFHIDDSIVTLQIKKSETLDYNYTLLSGITTQHFFGNILTVSTGRTLTLNNDPIAEDWQIFTLAGTGAVVGINEFYANCFGGLENTVAAIGTDSGNIKIRNPQSIVNSLSVSSKIQLTILSSGIISIPNTKVLTFNGTDPEAGNYKIFSLTGTGSVTGLKESNVLWFEENTTPGTTDMTAALQASLDSLDTTTGGEVIWPAGRYKTTAELTAVTGTTITGDGITRDNATSDYVGVTSIYAVHTGASILSLKGAVGCRIRGIALESDVTTYPKTALILGRDSASSAGNHIIGPLTIRGYYSESQIYSIASETNVFRDVQTWLYGGGALYCVYTSKTDDLTVDNLTTSTNIGLLFDNCNFISSVNNANAAVIYDQLDAETGSHMFNQVYLQPFSGAYYRFNNVSATTPLGPFQIIGGGGERLSGGDPTYGIYITSSGAITLNGLTIINPRFDLQAGATHYTMWLDSTVSLLNPHVVIQPAEAFPYALVNYDHQQITGGIFSVGRIGVWTAPTLLNAWVNSLGAPAAQVGYMLDATGKVRVRGLVSLGAGVIFTLPTGFRPKFDQYFESSGNGAHARLKVFVNGNVTLETGSGPQVNLGSIVFGPG